MKSTVSKRKEREMKAGDTAEAQAAAPAPASNATAPAPAAVPTELTGAGMENSTAETIAAHKAVVFHYSE